MDQRKKMNVKYVWRYLNLEYTEHQQVNCFLTSMNNFLEGFEIFSQEPEIDFMPEYRLYYNKETGDVDHSYVTSYGVQSSDNDYIVITEDQYRHLRFKASCTSRVRLDVKITVGGLLAVIVPISGIVI